MKKLLIIVLAGVIVFGCKKTVEKIFDGFDATMSTVEFDLPAIPFVGASPIPMSFNQHFDFDSLVRVNTNGTFTGADITSVKLKSINLVLPNATADNNISNFQSARFEMYSNVKTNPVEVLSANFPDVRNDSMVLTSASSPELKEYLKGTELTYLVYAATRRPTTQPLRLRISTIVTVK